MPGTPLQEAAEPLMRHLDKEFPVGTMVMVTADTITLYTPGDSTMSKRDEKG